MKNAKTLESCLNSVWKKLQNNAVCGDVMSELEGMAGQMGYNVTKPTYDPITGKIGGWVVSEPIIVKNGKNPFNHDLTLIGIYNGYVLDCKDGVSVKVVDAKHGKIEVVGDASVKSMSRYLKKYHSLPYGRGYINTWFSYKGETLRERKDRYGVKYVIC